ncbi:MAG: hypothetical protein U0804_16060 [Gemmataceae bacterium]
MRTTSTRRYGVAELVALLADLARPVTDAWRVEAAGRRAVLERTNRAAAWVRAALTRRPAVRATVLVDDGRRSAGRSVVWDAVRVAAPVPAVEFRAVQWEPDMNEPTDPTFTAPAPTPAPAAGPWGVELPKSRRVRRAPGEPVPADVAPVVAEVPVVADEPTPAAKPTRKPRARKPATPKVKLMDSAARVTEAPAPVAAVYVGDVRPVPLARLAAGINSTRFSGAETVRSGWATDSKVAVRVPEADREALAAKVEGIGTGMGGFRAPDFGTLLPKSIDPRPFVLTGREWDGDQEAVGVLTREDGAVRRVDLRLFLSLLHHSPKGAAVYAMSGTARGAEVRPLVAVAGDPAGYTRNAAAGLLMPLVTDGERYTPWHEDDRPLTLRGDGSTYTLTRGEWRALLPYLAGATAVDLAAAGGAVALTAKERAKLASVIDSAGGAAAVAKLIGEGEGAATAAA